MATSRPTADAPRPSPDALLRAVVRADRSRLKIFMGAAPGVGKTYAMLQAAWERKRDGVDVVVGVVETHGRAETEALLAGQCRVAINDNVIFFIMIRRPPRSTPPSTSSTSRA